MNKLILILFGISFLFTTSLFANEESMEAQELLYDWDNLVGETVTFSATIETVDVTEKSLSFGGNIFYRVLANSMDRKQFLWVAENCEPNYYCWMTVTGKPQPSSDLSVFTDFVADSVSIEVYYASAVTSNGWAYFHYFGTEEASAYANADLEVEGVSAGCCVTFEHWVPLERILDESYGVSFALYEGEDDIYIYYEDEFYGDENDDFVMDVCKEGLKSLNVVRRAITSCELIQNHNPFE